MKYRVLGPLTVHLDGETTSPGTPRERAVLALLALNAGRPVGRSDIVELLWGDDPPASATKTVQAYVSRLRRSADATIESAATTYTLVAEAAEVDALVFQTLSEQARSLVDSDLAGAERLLVDALELWRGPPFGELPESVRGATEAARLDEMMLSAAEQRLEMMIELDRADEAIGDAMLLCRSHPMREHGWAVLMRALYCAGRQAEALRTFQHVRTMLGDELGIEPGDELVELDARIAAHDPTLGPSVATAEVVTRAPAVDDTARLVASRPESGHLVGRDDELSDVFTWWSSPTGAPMLTVDGEPGIGKSALVRSALAAIEGPVVLAETQAHEGLADGLATLADIAVQLLTRVDMPTARQLAVDDPAALVVLAPTLARVLGDPGPVTSELFGHRLAGAFTSLVERVASTATVLIAIDDIHWCSSSSLGVLRQLLRMQLPVKVIATARTVDTGDDGAYRRFLVELTRDVEVDHIELGGISAGAVSAVLPDGRLLAGDLATSIHAVSGGHPLFASSLVQELDRGGFLSKNQAGLLEASVDVTNVDMPVAVRRMVERRLADAAGRLDLLERIAVLGPDVDEDLCVELFDFDADDLLDLLDEAVEAHLVDETDTGTYRFRHDLVRTALAYGVRDRRVARIHGRAFDILASRTAGLDKARAVSHGLAGGVESGDVARAAVAAAEHAAASFVPDDEIRLRRVALEQMTNAGIDGPERVRAEIDLGIAMIRGADSDAAHQRARAIAMAEAAGDPVAVAEAAVRIGIDYSLGPTTERIDELGNALDGLADISGHEDLRIEVSAALAAQLWAQPDHERRRHLIVEALDATTGRRDITRCRVLASATWALPGVADLGTRGRHAEELVALATTLEMPFEVATGLNEVAAACFGRGELAGGLDAAHRLSAARERYRLPVIGIVDISLRAGIAVLHGRLDDAWDMIREAIDMAEDDGVAAVGLGPVGRPIIELAVDRGDVPRIPAHLFDFGDMLDTYPPYRMSKLYARVFMGDPSAADDIEAEIAAISTFPPDIGHLFAANRLAAVVDLADGDVEVGPVEQVLLQYSEQVDWSGSASSGPASLWLGVLARRKGDVENALTWLAKADEAADALDAPLWRSRILRERALLARIGGPPAPDAAARSRDLAAASGAHLIVRLLDRDGL